MNKFENTGHERIKTIDNDFAKRIRNFTLEDLKQEFDRSDGIRAELLLGFWINKSKDAMNAAKTLDELKQLKVPGELREVFLKRELELSEGSIDEIDSKSSLNEMLNDPHYAEMKPKIEGRLNFLIQKEYDDALNEHDARTKTEKLINLIPLLKEITKISAAKNEITRIKKKAEEELVQLRKGGIDNERSDYLKDLLDFITDRTNLYN